MMKYKNICKQMKRKKFGIVGGLLCLGLASSALGSGSHPGSSLMPIQKLEQVVALEQAESVYKQKLKEYASDKILKLDEITDLSILIKKRAVLEEKERSNLKESGNYAAKSEKVKSLKKKTEEYKLSMSIVEKLNLESLALMEEKIENFFSKYYPSLKDEKINVVYSADAALDSFAGIDFKNVCSEIKEYLPEFDFLSILLNKNEYILNDVLRLQDILTQQIQERERISDDTRYVKQIVEGLKTLEGEFKIVSEDFQVLDDKVSVLEAKFEDSLTISEIFSNYLDIVVSINNFEERYGNFNNKLFVSSAVDAEVNLDRRFRSYEYNISDVNSNLKDYFGKKGVGIETIEGLNNPAKMKWNFWFGFSIGWCLPILRNILLKRYLTNPKSNVGGQYAFSGVAGVLNGALGVFLIDGLFPGAFTARMLSPVLLQPIFRLLKVDPGRSIANC